jgi:ABC-type uncharacterized transport system substrate-binding protein
MIACPTVRENVMRRREFITLLAGAAVTWPVFARAQQPEMRMIGFLRNTAPEQSASLVMALRKGLEEAGYVEGTNLAIEFRWSGCRQERLRGMADDLVHHKAAVIVGGGDAAILAAKAATATVPIVFATGNDPVTLGVVESLNHPEANITGVTFLSNVLRTKQLELLHEVVPKATVLAMLSNANIPVTEAHVNEQQKAARALGVSLHTAMAASERDLEPAFAQIAQSKAGGLYIDGDSLFTGLRKQLVALSIRHKIPTIFNE